MHYKHWSHEAWEPGQNGLLLLKVQLHYLYLQNVVYEAFSN